MIQLSGIQNSGSLRSGKMAEKEGEPSSAFEALLQLMGQQKEMDPGDQVEISSRLGVLIPIQQTELKIRPIFEPISAGIQKNPFLAEKPVEPKIPLNNGQPQMELANSEQLSEIEIDISASLQDNLREEQGETIKDFSQNQLSKNAPTADPVIIVNPTSLQPSTAPEKTAAPQIVRAAHIDQDFTSFIQSAIHVKGVEDGVEAAFTLAPKHLGKVDVKVTIHDGQVTAEFLTTTPLGRDLLETHVQTLRSALETQGLHVGKIDIAQQLPQTSTGSNLMGSFSQQGDSNPKQPQQQSRRHSEQAELHIQDDFHDYGTHETGWVSKINTTA